MDMRRRPPIFHPTDKRTVNWILIPAESRPAKIHTSARFGWYVSKMQAEIALELFYKHFPKAKITNEEWLINMAVRDLMKLEVVLVTE